MRPQAAPQSQSDMKPVYSLLGLITLLAVVILALSAVRAESSLHVLSRPEAACHTVPALRSAVGHLD